VVAKQREMLSLRYAPRGGQAAEVWGSQEGVVLEGLVHGERVGCRSVREGGCRGLGIEIGVLWRGRPDGQVRAACP
jgi:hypothetical protein